MEHLALYSELNLSDFCNKISDLFVLPKFVLDSENETEWGESKKGDLQINVSRPFEIGTLQEWDDTVPEGCNFGIIITKPNIKQKEVEKIGELITNEFKTSVFHHRTWLGPGQNIRREIEIKGSYNNI
ncbi:hypothetical protein [Flammeovirga sp. SJP92]|uniref:hypothetical protein n=1 Tax=Flammeovirga sp. SJP92 TaxID=1775430 RepID=UPI0007887C77|nr:hypothetical protein [Flammeovirga sp. SJP92]KXX66691.1 hypothetical protein AVL50_31100 [Flammeovirga sp. SJP92]